MKKQGLLAGIAVLVFTVAGCGKNMEDVPQIVVLSEEHSEEYHGKENADPDAEQIEIGRASCWERVFRAV